MKTFADIMALWPTVVEFAEDAGVPEGRARGWKHSNSIPGQYWRAIVASAEKRGLEGVTTDVLAEIAAASSDKVPA